MYVYLCTGTPDSTHKSADIRMYRELSLSLSSIESFESSSLIPTESVDVLFLFPVIEFRHFSSFEKPLSIM